MRAFVIAVLAMLALAGCAATVNRISLDETRLTRQDALPELSCAYRLHDVVDARPAGNRAGGLGNNMMLLADAVTLVRGQLLKAGLLPADAAAGSDVVVRLRQMYLTQNRVSKIPVVVYEIQMEGQQPFLIRPQMSSMNWNSSQDEAFDSISGALDEANRLLITSLNEKCAVGAPT